MSTVIIAGSRTILEYNIQSAVDESGFEITELVNGCQVTRDKVTKQPIGGIDWLASEWAKAKGIPIQPFPADWNTYGLYGY